MKPKKGDTMNDAQRDQLAQMLGPINDQAAKNKLETDYENVSHQLHAFIKQQRINPEDLPNYKVQKVVSVDDCMTIITTTGQFVHVSVDTLDYGDTAYLSTGGHPDIEDAHDLGILSQEQYDGYKKAQQAYLEQRRKTGTRDRLERLVRDVGADNVQEYLDEL